MAVTGQFEFRKTFWGKLVLQMEEEVKPFWQSKPKRRWRDATLMDLAAPEMRHLIDIGRKSRPASLLFTHKEPEPPTDLSAPADSAKMVHHKSWLALTAVAVIGLAAPAGARPQDAPARKDIVSLTAFLRIYEKLCGGRPT